jgi:hypothetical protein
MIWKSGNRFSEKIMLQQKRPSTRRGFFQHFAAIAVVAMVLSPLSGSAQQSARTAEPPVAIEVQARPLDGFEVRDPSRRRFGALEFRGGLVLTSPYREFGGLSGLKVSPDGKFIAVTDKGRWLEGRIVYRDQIPVGIADATMAPVLGPDGKPLAARGWYDTESIAHDGGTLYVGIERVNRIVRFDYAKDGLRARGQPIPVPAGIGKLPNNKGLEALAFVPKGSPLGGTLIAVSERGLDGAGNIKAFLIGGPSPGEFAVKRKPDFDISDAALLPGGDLLLLERSFSILSGVGIRIRRIAQAGIVPGAVVDGPEIFLADLGYQLDNMEALAVHRDASGAIVLTMLSDDNFSPIQRTLLLQFTLVEE